MCCTTSEHFSSYINYKVLLIYTSLSYISIQFRRLSILVSISTNLLTAETQKHGNKEKTASLCLRVTLWFDNCLLGIKALLIKNRLRCIDIIADHLNYCPCIPYYEYVQISWSRMPSLVSRIPPLQYGLLGWKIILLSQNSFMDQL